MLLEALCSLLLIAATSGFAVNGSYYTAAVYEYAVDVSTRSTDEVVSREPALRVMNANLDTLETQASIAKLENADIFVFPEYGISGSLYGLLDISSYLEIIPDVGNDSYCPCSKEYIQKGEEVLHRLSCIASNITIYIAANMGDKVPCSKQTDFHCPFIGHYQYNTEVVFNHQGCLVAKYHKYHLFLAERLLWNQPRQIEYSYFDTDFGRFGLMICFDAVYKSPAIDLVEKYNVTDIIFSTAWMNVYPHYVSVAYHSGWARTMNVNYLASNLHNVLDRYVGSGIYSPDGIIDYTFSTTSERGTLVVAQVPINPVLKLPLVSGAVKGQPTNSSEEFFSYVFGDKFKFISLNHLSDNLTICHGTVCCYLDYTRSECSQGYALGVFDGMHYREGKYYLEVCLLTQCSTTGKACGSTTNRSTDFFLSYNLTGAMNTKYSFPEVFSTDNFTTDWGFVNDGYSKTIYGVDKNLSTVALMGRNFAKDEPVVPEAVICYWSGVADGLHISYLLLMFMLAIAL